MWVALLPALILAAMAGGIRRRKAFFLLYTIALSGVGASVVTSYMSGDYTLGFLGRAGQTGSLLTWLLALCIITWVYPWGRVSLGLLLTQGLLSVAYAMTNPLVVLLSAPADGFGFQSVQASSWTLAYLPLVAIGYALLTVPFLEGLLTFWGVEIEQPRGRAYLHLAMIALGLGLALMGVRTYNFLGRGGFWIWNPVESAVLVPWLFIVAAWHLYDRRLSGGLVLVAQVAVFWAAFIARVGNIGGTSVRSISVGPSIYWLGYFVLHLLATGHTLWRFNRKAEPLPVLWQAVSLYGLWVMAGTAFALLSPLLGLGDLALEPGYYRAGGLPALALVLWSLRHSLYRDGSASGLAHLGVVMFLLAAVVGVVSASSEQVLLEREGEVQVFGYSLALDAHADTHTIQVRFAEESFGVQSSSGQGGIMPPVVWRRRWEDMYVALAFPSDRPCEIASVHIEQPVLAHVTRRPLMNLIRIGTCLVFAAALIELVRPSGIREKP
jgi:cytochrome c biogenesis factor